MTKTKVWIVDEDIEAGVLDETAVTTREYGWHLAVDVTGRLRVVFDDGADSFFSDYDPHDGCGHSPIEIVG